MSSVRLNPEQLAALEAGLWRAYYDRKWLRVVKLMVQLNQQQFSIPFPLSLVAAYYIARASIAWAPVDNDHDEVRRQLLRYYRIARRWSALSFEPRRATDLEVGYWIEHRRLSGQPDKSTFIDAMTALHAELFGLPAARVRESAEWRVRANNKVDVITSGSSSDPEADWASLEEDLRQCYRSIDREREQAAAA
jgi:hypothetical protein